MIILREKEKLIFMFLLGGFIYGLCEIGFRGYTHWSMILTGGSAAVALTIINGALKNYSVFLRALAGAGAITALELTVGIVVNEIFGLGVWDYSALPFNLLGQISLPFSVCWYAVSLTVFILMDILFSAQNKESRSV